MPRRERLAWSPGARADVPRAALGEDAAPLAALARLSRPRPAGRIDSAGDWREPGGSAGGARDAGPRREKLRGRQVRGPMCRRPRAAPGWDVGPVGSACGQSTATDAASDWRESYGRRTSWSVANSAFTSSSVGLILLRGVADVRHQPPAMTPLFQRCCRIFRTRGPCPARTRSPLAALAVSRLATGAPAGSVATGANRAAAGRPGP